MKTIGSLFSGAGGLDLAVEAVFGGHTVWHCEIDPAASKVLAAHWPDVPNLGDITAVDWTTVEPVDVLCGGFPCQDVSLAAVNRHRGLSNGTRSGLWSEYATAIAALRPVIVVIENVRGLLSARAHRDVESAGAAVGNRAGRPALRAAGAVLGDLADLGYDAQWATVSAASVGAPHRRERVFILATDGPVEPLPVPQARDYIGPADIALLCTPSASDGAGGKASRSGDRIGELLLGGQAREMATGWGKYELAIRRWESVTRLAPAPTEPGRNGNPRLAPPFSEWLIGWPTGWVTAVDGITRNDRLRIIGNGVVPQQATHALTLLLDSIGGCGCFIDEGNAAKKWLERITSGDGWWKGAHT